MLRFMKSVLFLIMVVLLVPCLDAKESKKRVALDTTPPVLTLNGEANITLEQGEAYTELGATAVDDRDGNVSVVVSGDVNSSLVGVYTVVYSAVDEANNISRVERVVRVVNSEPILQSLILSMGKTHFIREKSTYAEGYYSNIIGKVKVIGKYSDGNSENLTDRVKWKSSMASMEFDNDSFYAHVDGNATISASLAGIVSNEVTIYINKEEEKDYKIKIINNDKSKALGRGAKIIISLLKKPMADVKLNIHVDPKDNLFLGYTRVNSTKLYSKEILFEAQSWRGSSISWDIDVIDMEKNNSKPYVVKIDNLVSDDPYYNDMKIEDIVVKPLTKIELIEPSIAQLRGAIRGVPIKFNVKSKQLGLTYTLINPPRGMKIIDKMFQPEGFLSSMDMDIDGVEVLWDVPVDMEEKTYNITMKATSFDGDEGEVSFTIKVPKTTTIQTKVINNELIVTDKSSLLYGMKMKGHSGEDISSLKLRSVAYKDVWKHQETALDTNQKVKHIVFVVDNMPKIIDMKIPNLFETKESWIKLGVKIYRYCENIPYVGDPWKDYYMVYTGGIKYDDTIGYIIPHKITNLESNGSKVFMFVIKGSSNSRGQLKNHFPS